MYGSGWAGKIMLVLLASEDGVRAPPLIRPWPFLGNDTIDGFPGSLACRPTTADDVTGLCGDRWEGESCCTVGDNVYIRYERIKNAIERDVSVIGEC